MARMGEWEPGTRRALLAGAGAAGVAATVAGCGGSTRAAPPSAGPPPRPSSGGAVRIGTADIPVDGGKIFPDLDPDGVVVTQPVAGRFKAFSATCTHRGCLLASVSDGTINCPCHGARYSISDGSVVRPGDGVGATTTALVPKTVTVTGGTITVTPGP
jgi:nitrite reductase/ring-hydroxylating ferredoxin subunit